MKDASVSDRLGVTLTLLLTATAYQQTIAEMMPSGLAYLTFIDYYTLACSGLLVLMSIQVHHPCTSKLQLYLNHYKGSSSWRSRWAPSLVRLIAIVKRYEAVGC
jgi:hypothetical protein